jgi:hypothetical protein
MMRLDIARPRPVPPFFSIVGLLELLEQLGLVGGRDARTGVTDRYIEQAIIRFGLDCDFASVSELNVTDEICCGAENLFAIILAT